MKTYKHETHVLYTQRLLYKIINTHILQILIFAHTHTFIYVLTVKLHETPSQPAGPTPQMVR